jgi:DNA recombination protein RmuC
MDWLLPLLAGLALGAGAGILAGRMLAASRTRAELAEARAAAEREHADARATAEREHADARAALERAHAEAVGEVHARLAAAKAQLETWQQAEIQRKQEHDAMRRQLEDSFAALAGKALDANSQRLLDKTDLSLKPFEKRLAELKKATEELEQKRERAYGTLDEQLRQLHESTRNLGAQSDKLATALRGSSQARGNWGEATLRRLVEMAQMSEHCDFDEQVTTSDGSRPDLVVRLPGKGAIPIDAKAPLAAYLDAMDAPDEATRNAKLRQHSVDVRGHVRELQRRDYGKVLDQSVDFTVLFLPGESFLAAALTADKDIFETALAGHVLLATPVTLLALLRTVRMNWDNLQVEENARRIQELARELFERFLKFGEHFAKSGRSLDAAVRAYNDAVGSFERRVVPAGRRLAELRVGDVDKLPEPPSIERDVRGLQAPE